MGSSKEVKERDVVDEMVEAFRAAWKKAIEFQEGHIRKTSALASGRERDVGEVEDEVNQIEEHLKAALKLVKICKECTEKSSATASGRTQFPAPESDTKNLQLRFLPSRPDFLPHFFYTGEKLGFKIDVELIDKITGNVVTSGPESCAQLDFVAVEGNFDHKEDADWTREDFRSHVVTGRGEKKLLTSEVELFLKNGVALLPGPTFTDNSSWIENKKIRLGVEVASGFCEGIRVREAISDPFVVKDCRGKGNEKHDPPAPDDEVWRLRNIGRNGKFHSRLEAAGISEVRHFLWKLDKDYPGLMKILKTKMTPGRWETLVNHARKCDLTGKYYVYYADAKKNYSGVVFKNVFEPCGLVEGGVYYSAENHSDSQKIHSDHMMSEACHACRKWKDIVEYHRPIPSDMKPSKRARVSATHVVTGAPAGSCHTDPQVRGPADPPVPFEQEVPVPGQSPSEEQVYEDLVPLLEENIDLPSPHRYPSKQAGGIINMSGDEPDHTMQADGTGELSLQGFVAFTRDDDPLPSQPLLDHSVQTKETIGPDMIESMNKISAFLLGDFPEEADGTDDVSHEWKRALDGTTDDETQLQPAPDHSNVADGTNELSVEGTEPFYPEEEETTEAIQADQSDDLLDYSTDGLV